MNISILVFGSDHFLATLPDQIRDASACRVEIAANLNLALSHIQTTPPDVLLMQASLDGSLELCRWLKQQTKLAWIYSILWEDRPHLLTQRDKHGWEWEFEVTSEALQQGADAYIWQRSTDKPRSDTLAPIDRLLLAHLNVAYRKSQKYRDMMRTNDLLSAIALADPLTEMNNRRALEWDLPRQIQKSRSHNTPLSLIILDVDHFKSVNDTYGHLVGDRVLQLLCTRLRHNMRFQDTPFRYGGEEFVIILGNTSCDEASLVAKRLNRLIGEQRFAISEDLSIDVTISLGASCLRNDDDAKGVSLLYRADQLLLQAKALGRNQALGCEEHLEEVSAVEAVSS